MSGRFQCVFLLIVCICCSNGIEGNSEESSLPEMLVRLIEMNKPVVNDDRQNKYCQYINLFLSHFGGERCMVAGSTQEQTRLRIRQDEGDYDYLIMSEKIIPTEALEYREDLLCFVHINGLNVKDKFPGIELIDDRYLPTSLLGEIRPEAFKHMRYFWNIFSRFGSKRGDNSLSVALDHKIKPGKTLVSYRNVECPELGINDKKQSNIKQISDYFHERLEKESVGNKHDVTSKLSKIANIVKQFQKADINDDADESNFLQEFGSLIDTFAGSNNNDHSSRKDNSKSIDLQNEETSDRCAEDSCDVLETSKYTMEKNVDSDANCNTKDPDNNENKLSGKAETIQRESRDKIILKYLSKSSKDFIPAFPISGKPRYLLDWKNRQRNWPSKTVVEDIYNSEFYVVAKPALTKREVKKDFCLAYNNAEIKLARSMGMVQKKVVLIIKAIKKSSLDDYSEILTTFHWKTAVYWKSEKLDPLLLIDTLENVLQLLVMVLEHMVDCLRRQSLLHFFIPSNLFAGMDKNIAHEIIKKIQIIIQDPLAALRKFFFGQYLSDWKYELIPPEKVEEFRQAYNDPTESSNIDFIVSILKGFSDENAETVKKALHDVLTEALPFFIEEEARGRNKNKINSALADVIISNDILHDHLINAFIDYLMNQAASENDAKHIAEDFLSIIFQTVLKQ